MKKYKCLAALMSVLLLSGCNSGENAETASVTVLEQTTVSEAVQSETTTQTTTAASSETTEEITEQTIAVQTESALDLVETTEEISILSERISDIIYSEYLEDCKSEQFISWFDGMPDEVDPFFGNEFISATCELIDLTGDGEDELIIQKQVYGGLMYTEFVVYSIKENKRLVYLYRPGIGFDLYTDSDNNVVVLIENDYHHDSDKYFFKFSGENQSERVSFSFFSDPFMSDNVSLMYFHNSFIPNEVYEAFDGEEIITYDNVGGYNKGVSSYLNTLEKRTCDYIEFQLLNTDFKSQNILTNQIEKYLNEMKIIRVR